MTLHSVFTYINLSKILSYDTVVEVSFAAVYHNFVITITGRLKYRILQNTAEVHQNSGGTAKTHRSKIFRRGMTIIYALNHV